MKVVYNGLARTEFASKIGDLFVSSFYKPIRSKLLFFHFFRQIRLAGSYRETYFEKLLYMKVVYNGLARTELSTNIQNLFVSSFYEPIRSKLLFFTLFPANSLGGVIYGDIF